VPGWLRNLTMIFGLLGWAATVASYLAHGQLPDALILGIPAGLILALAPPLKKKRSIPEVNSYEED
jgi:hypothetical protein